MKFHNGIYSIATQKIGVIIQLQREIMSTQFTNRSAWIMCKNIQHCNSTNQLTEHLHTNSISDQINEQKWNHHIEMLHIRVLALLYGMSEYLAQKCEPIWTNKSTVLHADKNRNWKIITNPCGQKQMKEKIQVSYFT